ncbi:MAG TPA: hypothetical protein VG929_06465 [Actinomycetota bacterium]|nr:hypothetical protein [Actinomycetota bacterium]
MEDSRNPRGVEEAVGGATYRLRHPIRYSAAAAVVAGMISFPLDLLLFDHAAAHALKVAISSSLTWFGVLLVMAYSQRVKVRKHS